MFRASLRAASHLTVVEALFAVSYPREFICKHCGQDLLPKLLEGGTHFYLLFTSKLVKVPNVILSCTIMQIVYHSIITAIVLLSVPLVIQARPVENKAPVSAKPFVSLFPISMISVLTNPDQYKGKRCRIGGFLHLQFEDDRLYFSKEFADYLSSENSIYVTLDKNVYLQPSVRFPTIANAYGKLVPQYFHEKVVMLEGTFDDTLTLHVSRILERDHYKDLK